MKKVVLFISAALAAFVMASCSQEDAIETEVSKNKVISFSAYINRQSRASDATATTLQSANLKVIAYETDATPWASYNVTDAQQTLFMGSIDASKVISTMNVSYSGGWTYSPLKFWPGNDGKVSFFSYNGTGLVTKMGANAGAGAAPNIRVLVPDAVADQKDLVAATLIDQSESTNGGQVNFTYKHILSKIGFKAKTSSDVSSSGITSVVVKSLKIKYKASTLASVGYYTFPSANGDDGSWYVATGTYHTTAGETLNTSNVSLALDGTTLTQLNDDDKFLMLVPQNVVKGDLLMDITYTIAFGADTHDISLTGAELEAIASPMLQNTQYMYNLIISANAVAFGTISVSAWQDGSGIDQGV